MWFPWANHPRFIHKVIGCQVSTPKFTQYLQRFSKSQVPNHQLFCEVPKCSKGLAQKPGKSPNRQISNLRHRYGFNFKIIGRFGRNPFFVWGYKAGFDMACRPTFHHCIQNLNSPLFPVAKAGQFFHFADIQTLAARLLRTEIQYIHSPSMTLPRLWVSNQKTIPENCATPSGRSMEYRLWYIDYGWLWYEEICSAYLLLGQSHILHNEWLGKWRLAQAQCLMHTTCRTQEGISRFFGKKGQNSAM